MKRAYEKVRSMWNAGWITKTRHRYRNQTRKSQRNWNPNPQATNSNCRRRHHFCSGPKPMAIWCPVPSQPPIHLRGHADHHHRPAVRFAQPISRLSGSLFVSGISRQRTGSWISRPQRRAMAWEWTMRSTGIETCLPTTPTRVSDFSRN